MLRSVRHPRPRRATAAAAAAALTALLLAAAPASAHRHKAGPRPHVPVAAAPSAADPSVTGPVADPSQIVLPLASYPLASRGYHESEFFFSGTANSYTSATPLSENGDWTVTPASQAPYDSRMVVVAPSDPRKFSGNVIVEWLNVSAGTDAAPDWLYNHDEILRSGDAYVGISAQAVGINAIKAADPTRYGALNTPGDSFSYDIFSQGGMAIRDQAAKILPGLHIRHVIAEGDSQEATRLVTYIDGVAPLTHVYDGYLVHSRGTSGAQLSQAPQPVINPPAIAQIRTDQPQPVLTFETETDVASGLFNFFPAAQPDSNTFRLWEVAGSAHLDSAVLTLALSDDGGWAPNEQAFTQMFSPPDTENTVGTFTCTAPFNTGEESYVENTAVHDLAQWVSTGRPPHSMPRFDVQGSATTSYALDSNGNVIGGLRTPAVDAPVATLSGMPPASTPGFCFLFGQTHPFSAQKLASLYPTHRAFVQAWDRATAQDERDGYLLPADAAILKDVAGGSAVR